MLLSVSERGQVIVAIVIIGAGISILMCLAYLVYREIFKGS